MGIKCMSKSVIKTKFAALQTPTKFAVIMEIPLYYQREDLELKQFSNGSFLGPQRKKTTCTQRNRWRKEDCFKLDLQFVLQFKTCRIKSMTKFFFKNKSYSFHHLHHYHRPNHHHCHYFVLLL